MNDMLAHFVHYYKGMTRGQARTYLQVYNTDRTVILSYIIQYEM